MLRALAPTLIALALSPTMAGKADDGPSRAGGWVTLSRDGAPWTRAWASSPPSAPPRNRACRDGERRRIRARVLDGRASTIASLVAPVGGRLRGRHGGVARRRGWGLTQSRWLGRSRLLRPTRFLWVGRVSWRFTARDLLKAIGCS